MSTQAYEDTRDKIAKAREAQLAKAVADRAELLAVVCELIGAIADKSIQRNPVYASDDIKWLDKRARAAVAKVEAQP